jgi:hypothetical protein
LSDKDFKVKNKLQVKGITSAGPVVSDASGNLDSTAYVATQYGGTGTTTSPTSGQILYSTSGTTYAPTTLTSLDVKGATYSENAPSSPVVGQIWVESDSSADSFDPNIIRRQAFTSTAAQTVYTTSVAFIEGYEQVYFNGLLLLRGTDYTTSNSNTVTLTEAAAVNDIVEVVTVTNLNSVNTYTQSEIDTALSAKLSTSTAASTYLTQSNAATTYVPQTSYSVAGKNAIINGGFDIWQRGTSVSQSGTGGVAANYTADRWVFGGSGGSAATISRQLTSDTTNVPHIQYCARFQRNSGNSDLSTLYFAQIFETVNSIPLAGKTVTLSFYARIGANFSSSSLSVVLGSGTGTDQAFFAFTGTAGVVGASIVPTTTWQRFTMTGTVATNATQLRLYYSYGPTGTAGANDYFEITGVQLELGSVATPFSRSGGDIHGELAKCQRYYWRSSNHGIYAYIAAGWVNSSTVAKIYYKLPQTMRIAPTSVEYQSLRLTDDSSYSVNVASIAMSANSVTSDSVGLAVTVASGLTTNQPTVLQTNNTSSGYLALSAEL